MTKYIETLLAGEEVEWKTLGEVFDTLTQSITEGLPREIELRRKQYEYSY